MAANVQSCCGSIGSTSILNSQPTFYNQLLDTCLKASIIALGMITAISSFYSFMTPFAGGVALGIYQGWSEKPQAKVLASGNFCTQGFIEQGTGVKLPREAHLLVNIALTADHLVGHHRSEAYCMLIGLYLGTWLGNQVAAAVHQIS